MAMNRTMVSIVGISSPRFFCHLTAELRGRPQAALRLLAVGPLELVVIRWQYMRESVAVKATSEVNRVLISRSCVITDAR